MPALLQYFRWGWLRFLRQLGSKQAADDINRELDAMNEIGRDQEGIAVSSSPASTHQGQNGGGVSAAGAAESEGVGGEGGVFGLSRRVAEALDIKGLLEQNTDEVDNLLKALEGSYIKPGVGGESFLPAGRMVTRKRVRCVLRRIHVVPEACACFRSPASRLTMFLLPLIKALGPFEISFEHFIAEMRV